MVDRAQVVKLALAGVRPMIIAHRMGCHPSTVHSAIAYARRTGIKVPKFTTAGVPRAPERTGEEPPPSHRTIWPFP